MIAIVLIDTFANSSASFLSLSAIALTYGQWLQIKTITVPLSPLSFVN